MVYAPEYASLTYVSIIIILFYKILFLIQQITRTTSRIWKGVNASTAERYPPRYGGEMVLAIIFVTPVGYTTR